MQYHVVVNGQQQGPFSVDQLRGMNITGDTMVWAPGMASWTPASQVNELAVLFANNNPYPQAQQAYQPQGYQPQQGYGQPQAYGQPQGYQPPFESKKTMAIIAIVVGFLFSCLGGILGIIALTKANSAEKCYYMGDYAGAESNNKTANILSIIAFALAGVGLIVTFGTL